MLTLILPFLLGAVLGTRFRVVVLFPVIAAVVLIALATAFVGGNDLSAVTIDAALAISCIQVGYFAGMLVSGHSSAQTAHWPRSDNQQSWPTA